MNRQEMLRIKAIKAMEFIARNINDEEILEIWLMLGVADGDVEYGDLSVSEDDYENLKYYLADGPFYDITKAFTSCMKKAHTSGGLYF